MRPRMMNAGSACPSLFHRAISMSGASACCRSAERSSGSRPVDSAISAKDALLRSDHTGERNKSMNGCAGTRGTGRPVPGSISANTPSARDALFRTSADGSLIPFTRSSTTAGLSAA